VKLLTVVGNRPQFVKAAAVSPRIREQGHEEVLVHSGQHYDRDLSELFFEELGLPAPDVQLGVGSGSHAEQTAAVISALDPVVRDAAPDAMVVYGDTNSTLGGALVAAKAGVPLAHVEAGLRSFDRSMPEEVNRVVADSLSDLALCPTDAAVANLEREGLGERAVLVGDVMADVAVRFGPVAERRSDALERFGLQAGGYALATAHRAGNVDDPERLAGVVAVLERVGTEAPVLWALHPRTRARLEAAGTGPESLTERGIRAVDPLGYLDLTRLLRSARVAVTDSGGLQKEAFLAGIPCLTMRDTTEWPETVECGWNRLVELDPEAAAAGLAELPRPGEAPSPALELYGGGRAGERVAAEIVQRLG
jgi:UDP-N-acetylglucosamine 2-epimerase (non-hydrolysing)/UDP-GlcNAc3NAcA epimerase